MKYARSNVHVAWNYLMTRDNSIFVGDTSDDPHCLECVWSIQSLNVEIGFVIDHLAKCLLVNSQGLTHNWRHFKSSVFIVRGTILHGRQEIYQFVRSTFFAKKCCKTDLYWPTMFLTFHVVQHLCVQQMALYGHRWQL